MPYALRSTVSSADLEVAEILMNLNNVNVHDDGDSEYIPDDDATVDDDYVPDEDVYAPEDDGDEDYVPEDENDDAPGDDGDEDVPEDEDEDYVPEDENDDEDYVPEDEDYVPEDDDDDDYVPEDDVSEKRKESTTENLKTVVRLTCSSIAKGTEIPREFWRVLSLVRKNRTPVSFKRWMLGIPPVKSIYLSFAKRR